MTSKTDAAEEVALYRAALEAGGKDNGAPGLRLHYHANYYGAMSAMGALLESQFATGSGFSPLLGADIHRVCYEDVDTERSP